jgi:hypothetical protein
MEYWNAMLALACTHDFSRFSLESLEIGNINPLFIQ